MPRAVTAVQSPVRTSIHTTRRRALGAGLLGAGTLATRRVRWARAAEAPPLRVALPEAPSTLDPQRALAPADRFLARQLYEPLLRFGTGGDLEPAAALAFSASEDGSEWTFALRPDLRWSDGRPLRAAQFVAGWLRVFSREVPDDLFNLFRPIAGAGLYRVGLVDRSAVGIGAPDDATLHFQLGDAARQCPHLAALWLTAPVAPGANATSATSGVPAGNGPFRLESWSGERRLRLAANEIHRTPPAEATVDLLCGREDVEQALTDYAAGDQPPPADSVPADVVALPDELARAALRDPRLAPLLRRQPRPATYWLACNVARKPLDNVSLRKALAYAIDRDAYVAEVLEGAGRPAYSLLPPGVLGHDPAAGATYRLRPEVARAFLNGARLGASDLEALSVTVPATAQGRRAGRFLQDQLRRHLELELSVVEVDRYSYPRALERRQYALAFGGWESVYPDPEAWFWLVFGADKAENRTGWSSGPLDRLWRDADDEADPPRRLALYAAAQQILLDEMPVIFLAQPERVALVHPRVQAFQPQVMDELPGAASLAQARVTPSPPGPPG